MWRILVFVRCFFCFLNPSGQVIVPFCGYPLQQRLFCFRFRQLATCACDLLKSRVVVPSVYHAVLRFSWIFTMTKAVAEVDFLARALTLDRQLTVNSLCRSRWSTPLRVRVFWAYFCGANSTVGMPAWIFFLNEFVPYYQTENNLTPGECPVTKCRVFVVVDVLFCPNGSLLVIVRRNRHDLERERN